MAVPFGEMKSMLSKGIITQVIKNEWLFSPYTMHRKPEVSPIEIWERIDSTNSRAIQLAKEHVKDGTVVIADEQIKGRGRMGRSFYSPDKTGLYLSMIVRRPFQKMKMMRDVPGFLTALAGVVAAESIFEATGVDARIKWVNDVYVGEKKAGGILTEGTFSNGDLAFAVIGIGLNLFSPEEGFPAEIQKTAAVIVPERDKYEGPSPVTLPFELPYMSPTASPSKQIVRYLREYIAGLIIGKLTNWLNELEIEPSTTKEKLFCQYYDRFKWMLGKKVGVFDRLTGGIVPLTVCGLSRKFELAVANYDDTGDVDRSNAQNAAGSTGEDIYYDKPEPPNVIFLHSGDIVYFNSSDSLTSKE